MAEIKVSDEDTEQKLTLKKRFTEIASRWLRLDKQTQQAALEPNSFVDTLALWGSVRMREHPAPERTECKTVDCVCHAPDPYYGPHWLEQQKDNHRYREELKRIQVELQTMGFYANELPNVEL